MKKRIISAVVLLLIFIPLLIVGGLPFRIAAGVVAILAYREIVNLKGIKNYPTIVLIIGLISILLLTYSNRDVLCDSIGLNYRYIVFTFVVMLLPCVFYYGSDSYTVREALELTTCIMYIGIILNLISNIVIYNKLYFIMLLLVTTMTDTFAYFTGVAIGKHKFSKVSPNKTIEGCVGGVVMGTILTSIYYMTFIGSAPLYKVIPVLFILSVTCELGDLFFSAMKRERGIKDFSKLIPGHGGVLDRIDSLTFVVAVFVLLNGII